MVGALHTVRPPDIDRCVSHAIAQAWERQHERDMAYADRLAEEREATTANNNN